ncbi:PaaI family thioesterase [Aquirufa sp. Wall-65K1]
MNPSFDKFQRIIRNPFLFKFFILQKLSAAFWAGLCIHYFDAQICVVRVKKSWFNQNPFNSMYFAVEAMAAEMSCGMLAFSQIYERKPAVSMLVEKIEASFLKKASGTILFTCNDGDAILSTIQEAIQTGEGTKMVCKSTATNEDGIIVAEFLLTWSFKVKSKS